MQMVSEVMTRNVQWVSPRENVQRAAQMMDELNVGALPVCDGDHLVGIVTDRDITVRATAAGKAPTEARVEEVMSADVRWCFEDQPVDEVMRQMADTQIRRVPVVSHDDQHKLIGIVALGDLATKAEGGQKQETQQVVEKVSSPAQPDRPQETGNAGQPDTAGDSTAAGSGTVGGTGLGAAAAGSTGGTDGSDLPDADGASGGVAGTPGPDGSQTGARP